MISWFAEKAVDMFFAPDELSPDDRELYIYGFFILFSQLFYFFISILFGLVFGIVVESIFFYFAFSVIRTYAGGIHASKESVCFVSTTLSLLGSVAAIKMYINHSPLIIPLFLLGLSSILIIFLCPLDTEAKRLTQEEKKAYKKWSIICTIAILLLAALGFAFHFRSLFYVCSVSLTLEGALLLLGKGREKKEQSTD